LGLASGERSRRLSEPQISQPDLFQHAQLFRDLRHGGEKLQRFFDREVQHLMNILAAISDIQYLRFVARALAFFADQFYVGQELHLYRDRTIAFAGIASPAGDIERKMARAEASFFRFRQRSEQVANSVEGLDV